MKIERRGKYPGVKLHLDGEECKAIQEVKFLNIIGMPKILITLVEKVKEAIKEDPSLLEERTEEEIKATLMKEYVESEKKLKHIKDGLDWKKVKVEVVK